MVCLTWRASARSRTWVEFSVLMSTDCGRPHVGHVQPVGRGRWSSRHAASAPSSCGWSGERPTWVARRVVLTVLGTRRGTARPREGVGRVCFRADVDGWRNDPRGAAGGTGGVTAALRCASSGLRFARPQGPATTPGGFSSGADGGHTGRTRGSRAACRSRSMVVPSCGVGSLELWMVGGTPHVGRPTRRADGARHAAWYCTAAGGRGASLLQSGRRRMAQ